VTVTMTADLVMITDCYDTFVIRCSKIIVSLFVNRAVGLRVDSDLALLHGNQMTPMISHIDFVMMTALLALVPLK